MRTPRSVLIAAAATLTITATGCVADASMQSVPEGRNGALHAGCQAGSVRTQLLADTSCSRPPGTDTNSIDRSLCRINTQSSCRLTGDDVNRDADVEARIPSRASQVTGGGLRRVIGPLLEANSIGPYLAIFVVAILEGFVLSTFLINGTIAFVIVGGLMARGHMSVPVTLLAIYAGTICGDALTFLLAGHVQRTGFAAARIARLERYRQPLAAHPFRFIIAAHLTPYLKGLAALLARGVVPWREWVRAEAVGALCGTLWFTGLGATGSRILLDARAMGSLTLAASVLIFTTVIVLWIRALRPCRIDGSTARPSREVSSRTWPRRIFFVVYYPFWAPVRWIEAVARRLPSRALHPDMSTAFPNVLPGDIFLVRLHAPAPWGRWAHTAIATDPEGFCHGFAKTITAHRFADFPVRYTVAHLRVRCSAEVAASAASVAAAQVGRRMALLARRNDTERFSCTSLVCFAYGEVGIDLVPSVRGRVVPDDLFDSPSIELLRIVFTEKRSANEAREGEAHARQPAV